MKYIKSFNESIRDKMTPKSKKEIERELNKKNEFDRYFTIFNKHIDDLYDNIEKTYYKQEDIDKMVVDFLEIVNNNEFLSQNKIENLYDFYDLSLLIRQELKKTLDKLPATEIFDYLHNYDKLNGLYSPREFNELQGKARIEKMSKSEREWYDMVHKPRKKLNESVRDEMIPKPKEQIINDLKKLSPNQKLIRGYEGDMSWLVKLGLEEGGELQGDTGGLLLQDACTNGRLDIVELLLDRGVDVNTPDALSNACVIGNDSIVRLLLDKGADPNYKFGEPLKKAAESGNLGCVKLLLVNGAEMLWATSYIEKLRPNVADYLIKYKRRGFLSKFKDYVKYKLGEEEI